MIFDTNQDKVPSIATVRSSGSIYAFDKATKVWTHRFTGYRYQEYNSRLYSHPVPSLKYLRSGQGAFPDYNFQAQTKVWVHQYNGDSYQEVRNTLYPMAQTQDVPSIHELRGNAGSRDYTFDSANLVWQHRQTGRKFQEADDKLFAIYPWPLMPTGISNAPLPTQPAQDSNSPANAAADSIEPNAAAPTSPNKKSGTQPPSGVATTPVAQTPLPSGSSKTPLDVNNEDNSKQAATTVKPVSPDFGPETPTIAQLRGDIGFRFYRFDSATKTWTHRRLGKQFRESDDGRLIALPPVQPLIRGPAPDLTSVGNSDGRRLAIADPSEEVQGQLGSIVSPYLPLQPHETVNRFANDVTELVDRRRQVEQGVRAVVNDDAAVALAQAAASLESSFGKNMPTPAEQARRGKRDKMLEEFGPMRMNRDMMLELGYTEDDFVKMNDVNKGWRISAEAFARALKHYKLTEFMIFHRGGRQRFNDWLDKKLTPEDKSDSQEFNEAYYTTQATVLKQKLDAPTIPFTDLPKEI